MYELHLKRPGESEWRRLNGFADLETACKMADYLHPLREHGWEVKLVNTAEDVKGVSA